MRIAVVTNIVPTYRVPYYLALKSRFGDGIQVFCQSGIKGSNVKTDHRALGATARIVEHVGLSGERLGWQAIPFRELIRDFDVVFVNGNPRTVSNVVLSIVLKLAGKPVVVCGHSHTAGANSATEFLRLLWWRLIPFVFVYTELCRERLIARGFNGSRVVSMNNGIDTRSIRGRIRPDAPALRAWQRAERIAGKRVLLSCARIVSKNRFGLMIEALNELVAEFPNVLWCVIGNGPERPHLQKLAEEKGLGQHVYWLGEKYVEEELAPWFMSAELLVHPGAIGLTLLHAYSYGLPVITHDNDWNHMPEISAFDKECSSWRFREGDSAALAAKLRAAMNDPAGRASAAVRSVVIAERDYNTDVMAERFSMAAVRARGAEA